MCCCCVDTSTQETRGVDRNSGVFTWPGEQLASSNLALAKLPLETDYTGQYTEVQHRRPPLTASTWYACTQVMSRMK